MKAIDLVLTLVFASVLLLFMSYPALRISQWMQRRWNIPERWHARLVLSLTLIFSLAIGLYLRFG